MVQPCQTTKRKQLNLLWSQWWSKPPKWTIWCPSWRTWRLPSSQRSATTTVPDPVPALPDQTPASGGSTKRKRSAAAVAVGIMMIMTGGGGAGVAAVTGRSTGGSSGAAAATRKGIRRNWRSWGSWRIRWRRPTHRNSLGRCALSTTYNKGCTGYPAGQISDLPQLSFKILSRTFLLKMKS